jgi:secreted trypsin-like serine protease
MLPPAYDIPSFPQDETVNVITDQGKTIGKCLGALIAPRIVLTASHCVHRDVNMTVDRALVANDNPTRVTRVLWDPSAGKNGRVDTRRTDVAILVLEKPIRLSSYPLFATRGVQSGTTAMSTARTNKGLASFRIDVRPVGSGYYRSAHFARPGDSGGPVYVGSGSHRRIIAVLSGGNDDVETLARVDVLSELIEKTILETDNDEVSDAEPMKARASAPAPVPPRAPATARAPAPAPARPRTVASADPGY